MDLINKYYKLLKVNFEDDYSVDFINRYILMYFYLYTGTVISIAMSIYLFLFGDTILAKILIGSALVFISLIVYNKKYKKYNLTSIITTSVISIIYLYVFLRGGEGNSGLLISISYPIVIMLFIWRKIRDLFSISFLTIVIVYFALNIKHDFFAHYSLNHQIIFVLIYLGIYFLLKFSLYIKTKLTNNLELQKIELKNQIQKKDDFIDKLSFKIRTPLNSIVGILNIRRDSINKDVIEEIQVSVNNLVNVVNAIPEFSEKKLQSLVTGKVNFNLKYSIKKTIELFTSSSYKNLKITSSFSTKLPQLLYGNVVTLKQVFFSIIDFQYTTLANYKMNANADISVIEDEYKKEDINFKVKINLPENIFEFEIIKNSYVDLSKSQLFKSIDNLISVIGGKLQIHVVGKNVTFSFKVSFDKPKTNDTESQLIPTYESSSEHNDSKISMIDANILLVEDDKVNQKIMTLSLDKFVKNIDVAENGKEALKHFSSTRYDLILMDIRMPLMDGFITTKKIREIEIETKSRVPIVAVTANALSGDREQCLDAGMDDYISKPFKVNELIKTMRDYLD